MTEQQKPITSGRAFDIARDYLDESSRSGNPQPDILWGSQEDIDRYYVTPRHFRAIANTLVSY
jgi:hypothetical protein